MKKIDVVDIIAVGQNHLDVLEPVLESSEDPEALEVTMIVRLEVAEDGAREKSQVLVELMSYIQFLGRRRCPGAGFGRFPLFKPQN